MIWLIPTMLHNSASRKIARSTLLSLCCWALSASAFAQITNVSTATTSTQAILSYTAPDPLVRCSLEVRENNTSKVVNDVNSMIFPNADIDLTRAGTLATGRRRVVVVGKRAAESGIDGFNHSRALQNNTQHTFKVTCGSQSTATGSFTTQNLPLGMTYNDPLPADPNHPGDYAWPDLNWTNHDWAIDPFTGVQIKMADSPRNATDLIQSNFASATPLSGSAWMGASNAIADDTAAATYSGTTKDWLRLEINVKLFFGAYHQGFNVSLNTFVPTFNAWCSSADCATASLDDRTIEYCISVDGVSCATPAPYLSTALVYCASNCTSTAYRFDSIVNPTPILADWYPNQKPTIDPTSFQSRSGSVKRVGTVVTLITGDPFSFDWHAGSTITIANVTYRIASVDNDQQLTLAGNYTDSEQNSPYTASNAYIFVRKKTATTHTPRRCAVIMTLWAWSSVMRNSAFSTVTTNSRGVKSSLTRMTLCRRGRSVLVRTLVFGLVTVSIIPAALPDVGRCFSRVGSIRIQPSARPWNRTF